MKKIASMLLGSFLLLAVADCKEAFAATLYPTNYGARPDGVFAYFIAVSNSYTLTGTNTFTGADVGKIVSLTNAGAWGADATAHQDFVAQIMGVDHGTNLTLNRRAGNTAQTYGMYGTCCTTGFTLCMSACRSGDTFSIPVGNWMVYPPTWDTNWLASYRQNEAAWYISQGGVRILGADRSGTVLYGCGAWQLVGGSPGTAYRGVMIRFHKPFTNGITETLTLENLTLNGGVTVGRPIRRGFGDYSRNHPSHNPYGFGSFPADPNTGEGWDQTHDAIQTFGVSPPWCTNNILKDLNIVNWRGEMFKGLYNYVSGEVYRLTNCLFANGQASGNNAQAGNIVSGCTFSNLYQAMELWQSCYPGTQYFENSVVVDCEQGIVIQGAETFRRPQGDYIVQNNDFQITANTGNAVVTLGVAQNVYTWSNSFHNSQIALAYGSVGGDQGSGQCSNIVFSWSGLTNMSTGIVVAEAGGWIYASNNIFDCLGASSKRFFTGFGGAPDKPVILVSNRMVHVALDGGSVGIELTTSTGLLPLDDPSNDFVPNVFADFSGGSGGSFSATYCRGYRQMVSGFSFDTTAVYMDDGHASQIPPGAQMLVTNAGSHMPTLHNGYLVAMSPGYSQVFWWDTNNVAWSTNVPAPIGPPEAGGSVLNVGTLRMGL